MSRIGKKPIAIPKGVSVKLNQDVLEVKGPNGTLTRKIPKEIQLTIAADQVVVALHEPVESPNAPALFGANRTNIFNMVQGVIQVWKKDLEIQGVGFRATKNGQKLNLQVGFSHPIDYPVPPLVQFTVDPKQTLISMSSPDKELLGRVAAQVRSFRPPELYKGKGIRYVGEHIIRKAGKAAGAVGGKK